MGLTPVGDSTSEAELVIGLSGFSQNRKKLV